MHSNSNNLRFASADQQQQPASPRRQSVPLRTAERLPVLVVRQISPPPSLSSQASTSHSLRQPHHQQPQQGMMQMQQQPRRLPPVNGAPPHVVKSSDHHHIPSSLPHFPTKLEYRTVSADEDDEEDSAVKLCGVGERAKSREEFSEGEPPEPQAFAAAGESTSDDSFEEDQEFLELQEREQIVDKYERGPDQKDVDPWENPDFELYRVTDRYGFVHKESGGEQTAEQKRVQQELRRERKWLRMLDEWQQRHPAKLPERIWKGVPDKLRLLIWMRMLDVMEMKKNAKENLYRELLMRARLISKDIKQIDLDINRTYRDNLAFRRRYDVKQQSLFNVLTAYAMMNTEVGYCQGMSQIAALFLMYMDEEDAFWCLHALLVNRKYGMHGFFVPGFPKLQRFQHHYDKVLLKYLPRIKKHLDNMGIPPIYLTKWWFGCFLDRVPFSLALRLWDVFLYFGDCILIAMAYNIMKMHRKRILKLSVEDFMDLIQNSLAADFGFSDDAVMESLSDCLRRLQNDRMAIPPPPNPNAPAELPTKPLGPVLTRSMMDIRSDIASVYSRCSRANSVSGRSPMVRRHHTQLHQQQQHNAAQQKLASVRLQQQQQQQNAQQTMARSGGGGGDADSRPGSLKGPRGGGGGATVADTPTPPAVGPDGVPVEPFMRRVGSTKHRIARPPPVPDEDGFVRMSPRRTSGKRTTAATEETTNADAAGSGSANGPAPTAAQHGRQHSQYDNVVAGVAQQQPEAQQQHPQLQHRVNNNSRLPQPRSSSLKHQRHAAGVAQRTLALEQQRAVPVPVVIQQQQKSAAAQPQLQQPQATVVRRQQQQQHHHQQYRWPSPGP